MILFMSVISSISVPGVVLAWGMAKRHVLYHRLYPLLLMLTTNRTPERLVLGIGQYICSEWLSQYSCIVRTIDFGTFEIFYVEEASL